MVTDTYIKQLAERLAAEWAVETGYARTTSSERDLAAWILTRLADPTSDCGDLLDDLCRERWTTPVPLRVVGS